MIDTMTVATIILMALSTYMTRVLGYLMVRNRNLSSRTLSALEHIPGCVLISVIAPSFVSGEVSNTLALAFTLLLATRFSLLPTVVLGVTATGILRLFL
jgi:uncharacterized membrane protein